MLLSKLKPESGNVFVIILVAVFLFGSLIFVFMRGAQKGSGNLTRQQSIIAAQEILSYARTTENAVDRVRRNGCSENEINFDNGVTAGYTNAGAPVDNSCDIFNSNGGKIEYVSAQNGWLSGAGNWQFNANFMVGNVGDTCAGASCADLNIHLAPVRNEICENINRQLGVNDGTIPVDSDYEFGAYTGTFDATPTDIADEAGSADLDRQPAGCVFSTADNENYFYYVLLAR